MYGYAFQSNHQIIASGHAQRLWPTVLHVKYGGRLHLVPLCPTRNYGRYGLKNLLRLEAGFEGSKWGWWQPAKNSTCARGYWRQNWRKTPSIIFISLEMTLWFSSIWRRRYWTECGPFMQGRKMRFRNWNLSLADSEFDKVSRPLNTVLNPGFKLDFWEHAETLRLSVDNAFMPPLTLTYC